MLEKKKFVEILHKMQEVNDFVEETNDRARNLDNDILRDFFNIDGIVANEEIIVDLLDNMFGTDLVSYWLYKLEYGKKYYDGCITHTVNDKVENIDLSTPEKLYDYLISEMEDKNE